MHRYTGTLTRHKGVSKGVIKHTYQNGQRISTHLAAGKQKERLKEVEIRQRETIQGWSRPPPLLFVSLIMFILVLSQEDRNAVEQMDVDSGIGEADILAASSYPPPGDEGFDISHEGGEHEVFEQLAQGISNSTGRSAHHYWR